MENRIIDSVCHTACRYSDFHSHILPGVDDGSDSVETSVKMMRMSGEQGVGHLFATPHFYAHRDDLDTFLERSRRAEEILRKVVCAHPELPDFSVGAEVYFFRGMSESAALHRLALGHTSCILIEMPFVRWTEEMYRELERIYDRHGLTPVIAHVERYFGRFSTHGIPEALHDLPVLVQSNAAFFLQKDSSFRAMKLLKQKKIHLLGSDCHNLERRPPNLGHALERIGEKLGGQAINRLKGYSDQLREEDIRNRI